MKVVVGDKVYIQNYDVVLFTNRLNSCPSFIMMGAVHDGIFMSSRDTQLDFSVSFTGEEAEEIKAMDYIIDFKTYSKKSKAAISREIEETKVKAEKMINSFCRLSDEERRKTFKDVQDKISQLGHIVVSLNAMLDYLKKKNRFEIPTA